MDPEFGVGIGQDGGAGPRKNPGPSLVVRVMELAGLGLVTYGLGNLRFGIAALGGAMIVGSYALYRRGHRGVLTRDTGAGSGGFDGPADDGGGD